MLFIIVWKVAELLIILKNITRGLKSSQFIRKVAFYLLPGLIKTLLNPQCMSSLVKY